MKQCFKNVYQNNHVPSIGAYCNVILEDAAAGKFYFYDSCGDYSYIDSTSGDLSAILLQIEEINRRLDDLGSVPDSEKTDVYAWMRSKFLATVAKNGTDQSYRVALEEEFVDIVTGLRYIAAEMGKNYNDIDISAAAQLLTSHGFTVEKGVDSANNKPYVLAYNENTLLTGNNRPWGMYYFNMASPMSLVVSAPHPHSDEFSENAALWHAQKQDGAFFALSGVYRTTFDALKIAVSTYNGATAGTFRLNFRGQQTAPLNWNADRSEVEAALESLSTIGDGNVKAYNDNAINSINRVVVQLDPSLYNPLSPGDTIGYDDIDLNGSIFFQHWVDEARNYNSVFQRVIGEFNQQGLLTLQYHGFSDVRNTGVPRAAAVVLSDARTPRTPVYYAIRDALERAGIDTLTRYDYNAQGVSIYGGPTSGAFQLTHQGNVTAPIQFSQSRPIMATRIQEALELLPSIGLRNVKVTPSTNNDGVGGYSYMVKFVREHYRKMEGPRMTVTHTLDQGNITIVNGSNVGLAAVTNGQARDVQQHGYTFAHMEISRTWRADQDKLRSIVDALARVNLPQLAAASFPAAARPGDNPSNSPVAVGRGRRTGFSKVWSPSDHVHPWSNSDYAAGPNFIAGRNNGNSGNVWRTPMQMRAIVGLGADYTPGEYNLQAWTNDPATTSTTFQIPNVGELQTVRVRIPSAIVTEIFENIHIHCTNTLIGSDAHFGIYQNGVLVAETGDVSAELGSFGYKTLPLLTPVDLSQGVVEVAFFVGAATQLPAFRSHADSAIINGPFSTSGARWATADVGLTDTLPPTLGAKTAVATGYWIGLS